MSGYNHKEARLPKQAKQMKDLAKRGVCAFCPENIYTETRTAIDVETDHWFVKGNDYPYERTKLHLLIIPKQHAATISHLSKATQEEFLPLVAQLEEQFDLMSYAIGFRSGDMHRNGGSVEHIHAHVIVGDTDDPNHEPVRFKVSSRPS